MTYWTVLIITILSGDLDGAKVMIPYPTMSDCDAATVAVSTTLPYDHNMTCWTSEMPSGSIRPMKRPEVVK